jgi:hypothetical protein
MQSDGRKDHFGCMLLFAGTLFLRFPVARAQQVGLHQLHNILLEFDYVIEGED